MPSCPLVRNQNYNLLPLHSIPAWESLYQFQRAKGLEVNKCPAAVTVIGHQHRHFPQTLFFIDWWWEQHKDQSCLLLVTLMSSRKKDEEPRNPFLVLGLCCDKYFLFYFLGLFCCILILWISHLLLFWPESKWWHELFRLLSGKKNVSGPADVKAF